MIGEEDSIRDRKHSSTVYCKSLMSEVYRIKTSDFVTKLQRNEDSWSQVKTLAKNKADTINEKILKLKQILKPDIEEECNEDYGCKFQKLLKNSQIIKWSKNLKMMDHSRYSSKKHIEILEKELRLAHTSQPRSTSSVPRDQPSIKITPKRRAVGQTDINSKRTINLSSSDLNKERYKKASSVAHFDQVGKPAVDTPSIN